MPLARSLPAAVRQLARATPDRTAQAVREGVPARLLPALARGWGWTPERLVAVLGISAAPGLWAPARDARLPVRESEAVVQALQLMAAFRAARPTAVQGAVGRWLDERHPALGGRCPAEFLGSREGRHWMADLARSAHRVGSATP